MMSEGTTARKTVGQRAASAVQWQFASSITQGVLQFGVTILLARLLPPSAFGLVTLATIIVGLATLVADLGLGPSLIQRRDLTNRHVRVGFTTTTIVGALLTVTLYIAAPFATPLLRDAALPAVLRVLAFSFLAGGVGSTARALLQRSLNFRSLFLVDVGSYMVGYAGIAVSLAMLGWGVWSLVWGALAQRVLATVGAMAAVRHDAKPLLARSELRDLLGFGAGASMASVANYVALNGDNFIVGRMLGPTALGLYGRAYALMNLPLSYLASILGRVLFPALSEIRTDPQRLGRAYLLAVQLTVVVAAPILFGMMVAAPHIVVGLYGENWVGAALPLQILCAAGVLRAVYHLGGAVAYATGNILGELRRQAIYAILVVSGSVAGGRWGIAGVACSVGVAIAFMYFAMAQLALKAAGLEWRTFLRAHVPGVVVGACVGVAALATRVILERQGLSSIVIFGSVLATCVTAVPLSLYLLPQGALPSDLFSRISRAIAWAPAPIRHSINWLLRTPS